MSPTRRALLAGAGAVAALPGAAAPAAASPHPDADLIAAATAAIEAQRSAVELTGNIIGDFPPEIEAESARLWTSWRDNLSRVAALRAHSPEGLRAKALALRDVANRDDHGKILEGASWADTLAWSLCDDLTGEHTA